MTQNVIQGNYQEHCINHLRITAIFMSNHFKKCTYRWYLQLCALISMGTDKNEKWEYATLCLWKFHISCWAQIPVCACETFTNNCYIAAATQLQELIAGLLDDACGPTEYIKTRFTTIQEEARCSALQRIHSLPH